MNFYENLVIFESSLDDKAIEGSVERIKGLIVKKGGEILKTENWGQKKLAYVLKKQKKGIYVLLIFKALPNTIAELEKFYKVFDPVFKFLIIKLTKKQIEVFLTAMAEEENKETEPAPSQEENKNV
ncbi:MAG TPA: 30S ribosomal protein S6 [Nitrospirae bacterium]|nr:30S ribosomal protein S6 [bacterium BMS3Abin10]GBE38964.1 30S ribosomal protein S6 [bacterium BMS3Bbin08]HDK82564.1 30S ribosomal protein S6 [Nitrospirota bacterium]